MNDIRFNVTLVYDNGGYATFDNCTLEYLNTLNETALNAKHPHYVRIDSVTVAVKETYTQN